MPQLGGLREGSCKDEGGLGFLLPSFVLQPGLRSALLPQPLLPTLLPALWSPVYSWVLYEFPSSEKGDEPMTLFRHRKQDVHRPRGAGKEGLSSGEADVETPGVLVSQMFWELRVTCEEDWWKSPPAAVSQKTVPTAAIRFAVYSHALAIASTCAVCRSMAYACCHHQPQAF